MKLILRNIPKIKSTLIAMFIVISGVVSAQDFFDDDAKVWLYLKADKHITKRFMTQLVLQNRFNNNVTEYDQINANIELSYRFNKHFKVLGGFVYGNKRKPEGVYIDRQQYYGGFLFREKIKRFTVAYRNLVQAQNSASYNPEKGKVFHYYNRNKLTFKYEVIKRVEPFVGAEINVPLSSDHGAYYINRSRIITGLEIKITKKSFVETYFIFQRQYRVDGYTPRDYIFGLSYSYSF